MHLIDRVSIWILLLLALTLGLAPYAPEPHIVEKLRMLFSGALTRPIDIFDLFMHSVPWLLLVVKLTRITLREQ